MFSSRHTSHAKKIDIRQELKLLNFKFNWIWTYANLGGFNQESSIVTNVVA
jgi:hypothetical protein